MHNVKIMFLFEFDAVLLPVKAGTETKVNFTSGNPSPLDDERFSIAVTSPPPPSHKTLKTENRLDHGPNLK